MSDARIAAAEDEKPAADEKAAYTIDGLLDRKAELPALLGVTEEVAVRWEALLARVKELDRPEITAMIDRGLALYMEKRRG